MKKFYSILSIALAFSMLALTTSCSDDDDEDVNKTEVLTSKKWSVTKYELEALGRKTDMTKEFEEYLEECEKDDYTTFAKDGSYKDEVGADDCDGSQEVESGTWSWKDGEKILVIDGEESTVVSVSSNQLVVKQGYDDMGIEDAFLYITFTGK